MSPFLLKKRICRLFQICKDWIVTMKHFLNKKIVRKGANFKVLPTFVPDFNLSVFTADGNRSNQAVLL